MRSLRYLVLGLTFIAIVAISVANRHNVPFKFDPVAGQSSIFFIDAPLFVFLFVALLAGFLLGGTVAWISQGRWRRTARRRAHEVFELRKENERLSRHLRILERAPHVRNLSMQVEAVDRPVIH
jgi:uncharacterized integral membrane protein